MASDVKKLDLNNEYNCPGWQETFDSAMDIIAIISTEYDILKINKAGCKNLGKNVEELVGKKCYQVVHGLDSPIDGCACNKTLKTGLATESEILDNGRYYLTTAAPIKHKNDNFRAFAHTIKDITQMKEAEKELKKVNDSLEEKVKERTSVLLDTNKKLAHEIEERKKSEDALRESGIELHKQRMVSENKNITLHEIIAQIEIEKKIIRDNITANIINIIFPMLNKLSLQENSEIFTKLIRDQLEFITSQYGSKLTGSLHKLTSREIELCNYVKNGMSSKEIAKLMNLSIKTISKHRRNIRIKLKITNSKTNLTTFLADLD